MSSTFALFTAGLAALAPVVSAVYTAKGDTPSGNAVYTPSLDEVVPAGQSYKITWNPTTSGKVSLQLCKGPSTNCVTTATIADSTENSGSYAWTPSTDLEPSQPTGYGIVLVAEDGSFQYSTQFGISNDEYKSSSSSSSSSESASASSTASTSTSTSAPPKVAFSATESSASSSSASSAAAASASSSAAASSSASVTGTTSNVTSSVLFHGTGYAASTGWGHANSTHVKPTGSMTVPSSLKTSTKTQTASASASAATTSGSTAAAGSASASATPTGAAAHLGASFGGLVIAAGIAVFAL